MGQRVYFIPIDLDDAQIGAQYDFLSRIVEEVMTVFPKDCGFLRLVQYDKKNPQSLEQLMQSGPFYYYGKSFNAIVGDLVSGSYRREIDWSDPYRRESLLYMDRANYPILNNVIHLEEIEGFLKDCNATFPYRQLDGYIAVISDNHVETIKIGNPAELVYYIPTHRCSSRDWKECIEELLETGLLPIVDSKSYRELTSSKTFQSWLASYSSNRGPAAVQPPEEAIRATLNKYKNLDYVRARIPPYTDEIFQVDRGSWDLFPYTVYHPGNLPENSSGQWLDLRTWKQELYAKDPKEDIAGEGEWAAIDFGTKSTIVAVWQDNSIQMRRIGMQGSQMYTDEELENPTILCFNDTDAFLSAYHSQQPGRPSTRFEHLNVAKDADDNLRNTLNSSPNDLTLEDTLRFLDQLKQWADDPDRSIYVKYNGNFHELDYAALPKGAPDPIEIYAYYIGLYLNNMFHKKIYLKYLLSYSATFCKCNLDRIQDSFMRGLKKSLPREVVEDEEMMKKFEVRLYLDEATAYAVSAVLRYRQQAAEKERQRETVESQYSLMELEDDLIKLPSLQDYTAAIGNGGLFYGVYDFGGGTLDYSFGIMTRENGQDRFQPLEWGGASHAGCENILEDLAYQVFFENRTIMQEKNLRCLAPPWLRNTADNPLIGTSPAARFNTFQLINALRDAWIEKSFHNVSFRLLSEDRNRYKDPFDVVLEGDELENTLSLSLEKGIEDFFQRQIRYGVESFIWQFEYTAKKHNKTDVPRFIFLGGNACKSSANNRNMVMEIFTEILAKEEKKGKVYHLHPVLPTKFDKKQQENHMDISCATAKSGVVYGMLWSRPVGNNSNRAVAQVCQWEMRFRYFQYHLGRRIPDDRFYDPNGLFLLTAGANDLRPGVFRYIGCVPPDGRLELLYTRKPEYGFLREEGEELSASPVNAAMIALNPNWSNSSLYCRPVRGSDTVLELWLSQENQAELGDEHSMEAFIGRFAFHPTPHYIPFDPDNVFVRFYQDDQPPSEIYSIRDLPTPNMPCDWIAFYTPTTGMCVQFGSRSQVESGSDGVSEILLPDDFLQNQQADIFCCRTESSKDDLLLLAYNGTEKLGEYRLSLWEQTLM